MNYLTPKVVRQLGEMYRWWIQHYRQLVPQRRWQGQEEFADVLTDEAVLKAVDALDGWTVTTCTVLGTNSDGDQYRTSKTIEVYNYSKDANAPTDTYGVARYKGNRWRWLWLDCTGGNGSSSSGSGSA